MNSSSNGNMSKVNVINSGSDSEIKMKEYAAKSMEELRVDDYIAGLKTSQQALPVSFNFS